jgi:hypothetical protein
MNNNLDQLLDYNEEPMELAEALASNQDVVVSLFITVDNVFI